MRKILSLIYVFSFLFLISDSCLSAPAGNPAGPVLLDGNYPTKLSLEAETVLERKLKSTSSGDPEFKGEFYTGKVSLYLGHKLDVYGLIGIYDGKVNDFINNTYIVETKADVVLGGGVSYVLYELEFLRGLFRLGADAKYRQFEPDVDTVKQYRDSIVTSNSAVSFKEWQASLGLAYQYKKFTPYVGMKYSDLSAHMEFTQDGTSYSDKDITSKDNWGLFYGADILIGDNVSFNIEARHLDEKAVNIGINARF